MLNEKAIKTNNSFKYIMNNLHKIHNGPFKTMAEA